MSATPFAALSALVIDASAARRQLIASCLWQLGLRHVYEAADSASALQHMRSNWPRPDLLVCDFRLGDDERAGTLRALAVEQPTLGLVISAAFDSEHPDAATLVLQACGLHLVGALPPSFTLLQLQRLIEAHVSPRRPRRAAPPHRLDADTVATALREQWIQVHYQPQIRLADNALVAVEALVRLEHPQHGLMAAGSFVPVADAAGFAPSLAIRVMELAITQLGEWWRGGLRIGLSINLSPRALTRVYLPEVAAELASRAEVSPSSITFELTEDGMPRDSEILQSMNRLRSYDFRLAVDDYGSGLTGLQRLKTMPFSELKIDRSVVAGAADDVDLRAILSASVQLARQLRLDIVAEGVERQEDWDVLREVQCTRAQGYLAAKPMPPQHVHPWAHDWGGRLQ